MREYRTAVEGLEAQVREAEAQERAARRQAWADDTTLYQGDNGRVLCGRHLGGSARYSGRDISGQPVFALTPDVMQEADAMGWEPECEKCGAKPSRLFTA